MQAAVIPRVTQTVALAKKAKTKRVNVSLYKVTDLTEAVDSS